MGSSLMPVCQRQRTTVLDTIADNAGPGSTAGGETDFVAGCRGRGCTTLAPRCWGFLPRVFHRMQRPTMNMETHLKRCGRARALKMIEQLPIPGWLPLLSRHLKLLQACAVNPQVIPSVNTVLRHHLEPIGLISRGTSQSHCRELTYIATEKGLRTLRVQNMMRELGITRHRRPLARFPDNDLVQLTAILENMVAEHRQLLAAIQAARQCP
jgi:hypothetical protein